ncbi:HNH endonuclease [Sphingobium sp. TKS]|uniref:HNH endonuclease n=1 Tax=Sphingobium sp. TKS TaxID=1315974 RepID=UPI0007705119|nr:HNH endonuclease [Sphingobium sp. TKS]AMK24413.1 HNH endonuclease [Sphingobium sp. TKS]
MTKLQKIRQNQVKAQAGCCYYCEQPMWLENVTRFAKKYRLSAKRAAFLRATAEHLIARSEGGKDREANIVAACHYCNWQRHRAQTALEPAEFMKRVRIRLAHGRWHGLQLRGPSFNSAES